MKLLRLMLLILLFTSCYNTEKNIKKENNAEKKKYANQILNKEIKFYEFKPDSLSENIKIDSFDLRKAYKIDKLKIIIGSFTNEKIDFSKEEKLDDYGGVRLLTLNQKNEMTYKSKGGGDIYLFEPHFYKNDHNNKVLIICQLAFEYFCGGKAFLIENNKIKRIGTLDIESNDMEISLTDIIEIKEEEKNKIIFDFKSDSLLIEPGGGNEKLIKNSGIKYIYEKNKLTLIK
ncbi:MAG: hypothetical protein ACK5IC_06115 [Moheibacter sp.]